MNAASNLGSLSTTREGWKKPTPFSARRWQPGMQARWTISDYRVRPRAARRCRSCSGSRPTQVTERRQKI